MDIVDVIAERDSTRASRLIYEYHQANPLISSLPSDNPHWQHGICDFRPELFVSMTSVILYAGANQQRSRHDYPSARYHS
jgi:hypothetical protein